MAREDGTGKLHPDHASVIPNAMFYPAMDSYGHYRFGLTMAGTPQDADHPPTHPFGPIGEHPFSAAYAPEDQAIINMAAKLCGFKPRKLSVSQSKEPDDVYKFSPVNHNSGRHRHPRRPWQK